jgi:hypothetical protein
MLVYFVFNPEVKGVATVEHASFDPAGVVGYFAGLDPSMDYALADQMNVELSNMRDGDEFTHCHMTVACREVK